MQHKSRRTGLQRDLFNVIRNNAKPGQVFTAANFATMPALEGVSFLQISKALSNLSRKGLIQPAGIKGDYSLPKKPTTSTNPAQAIYDLLGFMAAAEAPLRRAAKILEAVDNTE